MDYFKISNEKTKNATGKDWKQWFLVLDKFGAKEKGHYLTAKHLQKSYGLSGWWAQVVTIRYEKKKGYWIRNSKGSLKFKNQDTE